jgi:hypothetical protein
LSHTRRRSVTGTLKTSQGKIMSTKTTIKAATTTLQKHIVVLDSRWVFIGEYTRALGTTPAFLSDASCVRVWGTTAGLGQLALKGPTKETVLDFCGMVVFDNPAAVLFTIPCEY